MLADPNAKFPSPVNKTTRERLVRLILRDPNRMKNNSTPFGQYVNEHSQSLETKSILEQFNVEHYMPGIQMESPRNNFHTATVSPRER